jgi:hyaluronan synthase
MSFLGSVLVISGGLAFYRANIIRKNLKGYLNEKFLNMPINISDDSMLTLFALYKGKTVQQPTAIAFNMMPEKFSHHVRQQIRWQRGSFIRSFWRVKYLPVFSFGFFRQVNSWVGQALSTLVILLIFSTQLVQINSEIIYTFILVGMATNYMQTLKYLTITRSDESLKDRLLIFLLYSPIISLWSMFIFKPLRIYSMLTCVKSGWGTRQNVEVKL